MKRKNIAMSDEIGDWYEEKAKKLGISQSSLIVMALSNYMNQDKAVDFIEIYKTAVELKNKTIK